MKKLLTALLAILMLSSAFTFASSAEEISTAVPPFYDVNDGDWFRDGAYFCNINKYMCGTYDFTYSPNTPLTRSQIAVIFAAIAGVNTNDYANVSIPFTDVPRSCWYEKAVKWMLAEKITSGVSETRYGSEEAITREQLCTFIKALTKYLGIDTESTERADLTIFSDCGGISAWAIDAAEYAVAIKIIAGFEDSTIRPQASLTRAQMAVITKSYVLNVLKGDCEHEYEDVTCTETSYCKKCGIKMDYPQGHMCGKGICTTDGECSVCKQTVKAVGHYYDRTRVEPTCTENGTLIETCRFCGEVKTSTIAPLGHTTDEGMCTRCKTVNFKSTYSKMKYYLEKSGTHNNVDNFSISNIFYYSDYRATASVYYYPERSYVSYEYSESIYGTGDTYGVSVRFYYDGSVDANVWYEFFEEFEWYRIDMTTGRNGFYPSTYKRGDKAWLLNTHEYTDEVFYVMQNLFVEMLPTAIDRVNDVMLYHLGFNITQAGFPMFK